MSKQGHPHTSASANRSDAEQALQAAQEHGDASRESEKQNALKQVLQSPVFKSIALHSAIVISLLVSFNFSAKPLKFVAPQVDAAAQPEIVQATFIDSNVIAQAKRAEAQAQAAAQKRQQDERRKEEQRKEALRKKQVEETRKKREAQEKQEKIESERKAQDKLKAEQEKERAIEQQRIKEEKQKAEQKKRQEALDRQLAEQLAQEQAQMSQANQRRILSEVEKYKALVQSKVQQYLDTDGGFIGETCLVNVRLAPDGLVLRAEAVSGKPALCRIAKAAILRAQTLPMSRDPDVMAQFRQFDIEVSPQR